MDSTKVRQRFNIARLALQYRWLTIGFWAVISIAGLVGFSQLKYALFPDITFPVVVVSARSPAFDAEGTEKQLTRPLEAQLATLPGLSRLGSSSYPGQSVLDLSFEVGTDLATAGREVAARVRKTTLPAAATFTVETLNLNESAVLTHTIESNSLALDTLARLARTEIVPSLQKVPGVLKVNLQGDPTEGQTAVRFNGTRVLALQIVKRGEANTLEVVSAVEREIDRLQARLKTVQLPLATTQATYIREANRSTLDALALAVALSVLVIYPFLGNWRATLISALAIPVSLLGTFIVMAVAGFDLETITLLALALVIGIIVDDAIVDVENIARHIEEGETPEQAAVSATDEIGLTVTAATLAIVAVFLPVGLMGGTLGQFFRPFGLTVSAAVLTSLLVARTLSPLLASLWMAPTRGRSRPNRRWAGFAAGYRQMLHWALAHRWTVVALALSSFVTGIALIPLIPKGFIPHLDRGEFLVTYRAPLPTDLEASARIAGQLDEVVRRLPEVESVFTMAGTRQGERFKGSLQVKLREDRTAKTLEVENRLRDQLPRIPDVVVSVGDLPIIEASSEKPLQVSLVGEDLADLDRGAYALADRVRKIPGLVDVETKGTDRYDDPLFGRRTIQITHLNRRRVVYLSANLGGGLSLDAATKQVVSEAKTVLPASVRVDLGGDSERAAETFGSFGSTLLFSVLCIVVVLGLLFRNWADPLVIVLALPLSLVGALLAPLISGSEFGMISVIGLIFLLGLANKNAILLVDYTNQLRTSGLSVSEALLKAAPIRLRPILMTTAATILGMLPIALGLGAGAELRAPMAVAIIGGLVTSTLLSLLVIPVLYSLFADLRQGKLKSFTPGVRH